MNRKFLLIILCFCFLASCSYKYYSYKDKISDAYLPKDMIGLAIEINSSDIPSNDKNELNLALAKRALDVFSLYIKVFVDKKELPPKDELLDMMKFVANNINNIADKETLERLKSLSIELADALRKSYFKM